MRKPIATLASVKNYTSNDSHIIEVQSLYGNENLSNKDRCSLCFALAKIYEDLGELYKAFQYLNEGNTLRKDLLGYTIEKDRILFSKLKTLQPIIKEIADRTTISNDGLEPVFIIGMPRSGTTLVEQILCSHSFVSGAGELQYVSRFGTAIAQGLTAIFPETLTTFRTKYLTKLAKHSDGKQLVTDKMPHNFLYLALICAAFPKAKIIHVQRNAAATCWSNFKQYFAIKGLGYCYDLKDVADYFGLYIDLMQFWQKNYADRIYNINYEKLTEDHVQETKRLIKYLDLDWEASCLSPQKNNRSVKTASQQQVRQKIYQGSSQAWLKYEPFLNGAFNGLKDVN